MGVASMAIGATTMLAGSLLSYALTPKAPTQDMTNYDLLRQTQQQADADASEAKARQDEARKREELRTQQMYGQDIKTSDRGASALDIKETTLGSSDNEEE